nr:MAG TPA: hypothetical protein [Caudoviricetes sp.]
MQIILYGNSVLQKYKQVKVYCLSVNGWANRIGASRLKLHS